MQRDYRVLYYSLHQEAYWHGSYGDQIKYKYISERKAFTIY
jgi:hypothetical protein